MTIFDYNTGKPLAQGQSQSVFNTQTGQKIGSPVPSPYNPVVQPGAKQATVISDTTIRDSVIPDTRAKAEKILPPAGVTIGESGAWIDSRTYQKPTDESTKPTTSTFNYGDDLSKILSDIDSQEVKLSPEQQQLFDLQQTMLDSQSKSLINDIRSKYASRYKEIEKAQAQGSRVLENSLAMAGSSRYAPISSQNIMSTKEKEDIQTLTDLSNEENKLILQAQQAKSENDMRLLASKLEAFEKKKKEKTDLAIKIADTINEENRKLREEKAKEEQEVNKVITEAAKGGAPRDVLQRASQAGSLVGAVSELGDYLQSGSGIVGEYTYYKRQAEASGVTPMSFDEYQTKDANRKISVAQAAANAGGLSSQQQSAFLRISDKFQADTVMSAANKGKTAMDIANRVIQDPKNAGSQLSILYTLVKNLDPDSAVREGEIALAQETQSYLGRFGTTLEKIGKGQVVSGQTATLLANETKKLAESWYKAGIRRENQYKSQAKTAGIGEAFDQYLGGYERPYADDLIEEQNNYKQSIDNYYLNTPNDRPLIEALYQETDPATGKPYTEEDIVKYLQSRGRKISFSPVGGDTNQASKGIVAGYDIKSYATDPTHEVKVANIYSKIPSVTGSSDIDKYIKSIAPKSPITGNMVMKAASKYNVDPKMMLAIMMQDSTLGTKGLATKTFNPGNVGNTDTGATVNYGSWDKGVEAVAKNLSWRKVNNLS